MLGGGCRVSHHLRERTNLFHRHLRPRHGLKLGLFSTGTLSFSSVTISGSNRRNRNQLQQKIVSYSTLQSKSSGEIPIISADCFSLIMLATFGEVADDFSLCKSQQEDDHELPLDGFSPVAGGIVALGKFDALHVGHRELAIQASKVGTPYLLSFVGMAEVLGWESRSPIVAKCDRHRVLASWAQYCGNIAPSEFQIEFSSVRHLSPQQFVEKLSKELKVCGVVAGENYRFGYKAAGDASDLIKLCEECGMAAYIINSVMDKRKNTRNMDLSSLKDTGQVSSTRVRQALAVGDMKYVSELLGRRHRLMLMLKDQKGFTNSGYRWRLSAPKSCLLNLPPKNGLYKDCFLLFGHENPVTCSVVIDSMYIHLEMDELDLSSYSGSEDFHLLSVEFGD